MKKLALAVCFILFAALFFGCSNFMPPDDHTNSSAKKVPAQNADTERKDVLALKHLQIPDISEDTLVSYVMDFINGTAPSETGTARSVQSAPAVVISKTKKITHTVQTGFAETTADKRSARSVIGPGQIPFYVFTLENQQTGETGFALACGDNRIGSVLAVVDEGDYDDDNPGLHVFYSYLNAYIEDTIDIYNSITEADIEHVLKKTSEADRATAAKLPITEVVKNNNASIFKNIITGNERLKTEWRQGSPYNDYLNKKIIHLPGWYRVVGCGPVAIGQIMAFHEMPKKSTLLFDSSTFDWSAMKKGTDDDAIGKLMYEIYLHSGSFAVKLESSAGSGATATTKTGIITALTVMGYKFPGIFESYNFSKVKNSIDNGCPVIIYGSETAITIFNITMSTSKGGHYWVIDDYAQAEIKYKYTGEMRKDPSAPEYVHCNLGWGGKGNGWYISGVFNADKPFYKDASGRSATVNNFFQYGLEILTGIEPK